MNHKRNSELWPHLTYLRNFVDVELTFHQREELLSILPHVMDVEIFEGLTERTKCIESKTHLVKLVSRRELNPSTTWESDTDTPKFCSVCHYSV